MDNKIIDCRLSKKVLMAGNYYRHHHPGGISAVVQYWEPFFDGLQYYPTYRLTNVAGRAWWFASSYIRMAARMLLDGNVRIVHLHTAADGSFWRKVQLLHLARRLGRKTILHVHASRFKDFYGESRRKEWILRNLRLADRLIVLSESWKEWFVGIGVERSKIVVLHNMTAYPQMSADKTSPAGRPVRFLFLGEIGERKGVFDILHSMSDFKQEMQGKVELRIGGNKHEKELAALIEDGLSEMVTFEGWVSGSKKVELLNWADVFILPSRNEGLPISILEAMSYGMPIISTPVGGIPEVVDDKNGILVAPGNKDEIAQAMLFFARNPQRIADFGRHSQEVARTYLPDYVMAHLKRIYEELLSESQS